jgi:hypothetical protein
MLGNRVILKIIKTQHQNPKFGHTQGEIIFFNYISIQQGMKLRKPSILVVNWVSSCLSFFLNTSTAAIYIFTDPNITTTVISLEPCCIKCWVSAFHTELQHFMLRFHKNVFTLRIQFKEGKGGWNQAQRQGEDRVTLQITLMCHWRCTKLTHTKSGISRWPPVPP